jgi:hypothetical protein
MREQPDDSRQDYHDDDDSLSRLPHHGTRTRGRQLALRFFKATYRSAPQRKQRHDPGPFRSAQRMRQDPHKPDTPPRRI